jgi:predicted nucleic acid-binding protein
MLDESERGIITKEFFDFVNEKNYELFISEIVNTEITDTTEKIKRETILSFLKTIEVTIIPSNSESDNLAWNYITEGVLTYNHIDDLLHVAYATVHKCDMIVSWNRKHIAKPIKIQKLNKCNLKNNYQLISICTPKEFLALFSKEI